MARERFVGGNIIEIIGGNDIMNAKEDIITSSNGHIIESGKEGIVYGDYKDFQHRESCKYTPVPVSNKGSCDYYKWRFENFMERHRDCLHEPPEYYFGPLRVQYQWDILNKTQEFYSPSFKDEMDKLELKKYARGDFNYKPVPAKSYGYKYCVIFSNSLLPRLSDKGQEWLLDAKKRLQNYMEQGVIDKNYMSKFNKQFNYDNGFFNKKTGKSIEDKEKLKQLLTKYYADIELHNKKFQTFAFATHPDAYNPLEMSKLPIHDLIKIGLTPDFTEWMGKETWEQAITVAKNLDFRNISKATREKINTDIQGYMDEIKSWNNEQYNKVKALYNQIQSSWDY